MSGQTPTKAFIINKFAGLNVRDASRKIDPAEFVDLKNVSTRKGLLEADYVDAIIDMPVPKRIIDTIGPYDNEFDFDGWLSASGVTANHYAYFASAGMAFGETVSMILPRSQFPSGVASGNIFRGGRALNFVYYGDGTSAVNNSNMESVLELKRDYYETPIASGTTTGTCYEIHDIMHTLSGVTAGTGVGQGAWYVYKGLTATAGCASGSDFILPLSGATGSSAIPADTFTTNNIRWACSITKNGNKTTAGHILNLYPIVISGEKNPQKAIIAGPGASFFTSGNREIPFGRYYFANQSYKSLFPYYRSTSPESVFLNGKLTVTENTDINVNPDINIVEGDNLIAITYPGTQNAIVLDYNQKEDGYMRSLETTLPDITRKKPATHFNGYLVKARNGYPVALRIPEGLDDATWTGQNPFPKTMLDTCPVRNPKFVVSFNNYLMFLNVKLASNAKIRYPHRMYFSLAGTVNSWSSTQYENMSDGEEIIGVEEWFGSLILFFPSKVKRYSGVPGNASLETVLYKGAVATEAICKTHGGIFFATNDGLYLYNGSSQKINDKTRIFEEINTLNANSDGWMEYNEEKKEIMFYPGYSGYIYCYDTQYGMFRTLDYSSYGVTGGARLFRYYDNLKLKSAISYPGITHVSQMYAGTTCKPLTAQGGFVDVEPAMLQKRFDRAEIEYYATSAFGTFNAEFIFDDGIIISPNEGQLISLSGSGIKTVQIPLSKQAKLVQYKITAPAQTAQLRLNHIKYLYSDTTHK